MKKKAVYTLNIDGDILKRLKIDAVKKDEKVNSLLEKIIVEYLEKEEAEDK